MPKSAQPETATTSEAESKSKSQPNDRNATPAAKDAAPDEKPLAEDTLSTKEEASSATETLTDVIGNAVNQLFRQDGGDETNGLKPQSDF